MKDRKLKVLLEIMLKYLEESSELQNQFNFTLYLEHTLLKDYFTGLCMLNSRLELHCIISILEYKRIKNYLEDYLPPGTHGMLDIYCWPVGKKEPRIKWLKEQIAKL